MKTFKIYITAATFLLIAVISGATLEGISKVIGEYKFELGMIPETPYAGHSTGFSVALENATSGQRFSNLETWVRISHGDDVIFSSPSFKTKGTDSIKFSYNFQKAGDYEIKIRFTTDDGRDLEAEFLVSVKGEQNTVFYAIYIGIFVLGILTGYFLKKQKKR